MLVTRSVAGFSRLFLNDQEADQVVKLAEQKGRYLVPVEIRMLTGKDLSKTVTEKENFAMDLCWIQFCRTKNLDQRESMLNLDVFKLWWDWVPRHYSPPAQTENPWQTDA